MSREWVEAHQVTDASAFGRLPSYIRRGVLVEDGRDGEPTAEEAIREAINWLAEADRFLRAGSDPRRAPLTRTLAVLRRALESEAR